MMLLQVAYPYIGFSLSLWLMFALVLVLFIVIVRALWHIGNNK